MRGRISTALVVLILMPIFGCLINLGTSIPDFSKYYPNHTIVRLKDLNEDVQKFFKDEFPNFHPGCIKEDFDGDGIADYALLLRTNIRGKIVERLIVLKGKGSAEFRPINLHESDERIGDSFLRRIPAGTILNSDKPETLTLNRPGFEIVLFEAASRVYFWEDGDFHFIQTSD